MLNRSAIVVAAALFVGTTAAAQTTQPTQAATSSAAPKETPPPPAPAKSFRMPAHRTFSLPNGMLVTFAPFGTIPKVTMELNLRTGVIDEGPSDVSLASVVGDMLLEGTTTRSSFDISKQAAEMGGAITAAWGSEMSSIGGEVLSDHAADFVALVADVTLHPKFASEDLKRVLDKHSRDNAIALAQADNLVMKKFREMMYGNHPFARIYPTDAMLHSFTVERVKGFHATNYSAKRAHLYVSGVFDARAVEKAVRDGFGAWAAGAPPTEHPATIAAAQQVALVDRPKSVQSAMMMGVPAPSPSSPDWIKMNVTDAILGGAFGSRITANIREDKGYTYSPYSFLLTRKDGTIWAEAADVTTNVTGASLTEIVKEINRLRTEPPSDKELDGIKSYLAGNFTIGNSNRGGIINQLGFVDLHGLGDDYVTNYVKNVLAVTPQDVSAAATKYIDPAKMSIAIVGDKKLVDPQLGKAKILVP
ncbi:MAG TPA: pitrilysin family protein [Gemmatimonadaceae bacterium]|nr:pitrilysin family protein [Gemmatimonadaceae bacterium]